MNLYSNTIEYIIGISPKKQNEFAKYFNYRDQNIDSPITKKMISNLVGVDRHLIGKWDDSMIKDKLLLKDGFWYIPADYEKDENGNVIGVTYRNTDKNEFNSFMRDKRITNTIESAKIKLIENKITWDEYDAIIAGISVHLAMIENKYIFRINKFIINDKNELYEQLKFMVKELTPNCSFKLSFDGLI